MFYRENDNMNMEEFERYYQMTQEERDKLMAEMEKEILKESEELKKGIPKAIVTGKISFTEEEMERHDKALKALIKKTGVL